MKWIKTIHPHARLWIISTLVLIGLIAFKPATQAIHPSGRVVVYYDNDYQRYAIDELVKRDQLEQWSCLYQMWKRESQWEPNAVNHSSAAIGISQLLPQTWINLKLQPTGNGYRQVDAGLKYIDRHYGKSRDNICVAYAHHLAKGWY